MSSVKYIDYPDIGAIALQKRRGQKTIRISIQGSTIRVSQPTWLPFSAGEAFIRSKLEWIRQNAEKPALYSSGQMVGKKHILIMSTGTVLKTRIGSNYIRVNIPSDMSAKSPQVQQVIQKAAVKALRQEAEEYLPRRTRLLADQHGFSFNACSIKLLKRRWGSCNSKKEITYNLHLMSLADTYIDYVILHELTHTEHMNHGTEFWKRMEDVYCGARKTARIVRRLSTVLG